MDSNKILKLLKATKANKADIYAPLMDKYFKQYGVLSDEEVCRFLANTYIETSKYLFLRENLNYSSADRIKTVFKRLANQDCSKLVNNPQALAEAAYGYQSTKAKEFNHTKPGEGFAYRGAGFLMLTGKANFEAFKQKSGIDVVANPDILGQPDGAVMSACAFWKSQKCGQITDLKKLRIAINGGLNGYDEMVHFYNELKGAL